MARKAKHGRPKGGSVKVREKYHENMDVGLNKGRDHG